MQQTLSFWRFTKHISLYPFSEMSAIENNPPNSLALFNSNISRTALTIEPTFPRPFLHAVNILGNTEGADQFNFYQLHNLSKSLNFLKLTRLTSSVYVCGCVCTCACVCTHVCIYAYGNPHVHTHENPFDTHVCTVSPHYHSQLVFS